jgi:succinate dehydrogenase/fumarate reductase cytochrome b subunit
MSTDDPSAVSRDAALERALVKIQAASGALFAVFLLLHLGNQVVAAAGPAAYDGVQGQLRAVYHAPAFELVAVGAALVVHVVVSVWRMVRRRRSGRPAAAATRHRLQRWSAVVLLLFTFGHAFATRGTSLLSGVFPGFDAIAFTMVWIPAYFVPYYLVFSIAGLYHAIHGLVLALPRLGVRVKVPVRAVYVAWAAGAVALALGIAGFCGAFQEGVREYALAGPYAGLFEELGFVDRAALARE